MSTLTYLLTHVTEENVDTLRELPSSQFQLDLPQALQPGDTLITCVVSVPNPLGDGLSGRTEMFWGVSEDHINDFKYDVVKQMSETTYIINLHN